MGIKHLTGTPWHKERVHRQEGDKRRYKGRYKAENLCMRFVAIFYILVQWMLMGMQ